MDIKFVHHSDIIFSKSWTIKNIIRIKTKWRTSNFRLQLSYFIDTNCFLKLWRFSPPASTGRCILFCLLLFCIFCSATMLDPNVVTFCFVFCFFISTKLSLIKYKIITSTRVTKIVFFHSSNWKKMRFLRIDIQNIGYSVGSDTNNWLYWVICNDHISRTLTLSMCLERTNIGEWTLSLFEILFYQNSKDLCPPENISVPGLTLHIASLFTALIIYLLYA